MRIKEMIKKAIPKSAFIYKICRYYTNLLDGENNSNMLTNGELAFLEKMASDFRVVFDVGANLGNWTEEILKLNKNITVHCFEPSASTFKKLNSKNFPKNVHLNNIALGAIDTKNEFYVYKDSPSLNSFYKREGINTSTKTKKELVTVETLENYCKKNRIETIDLVKLDVEGYEFEVLKGMGAMLKEGKIEKIQFEYGGCNIDSRILLKDFFTLLLPLGYDFYKILFNRLEYWKTYDQRIENFQYQNWLAVLNRS
jgi:FkbM family methyltransferase